MHRLLVFIAWFVLLPQVKPYEEPGDFNTYHLVLLLKGPTYTSERTTGLERLQQEHLAYLSTLGRAEQAVIAGPTGDDGEIRGIVILKAPSPAEARTIAEADPAVKAGRLKAEVLSIRVPANWFAFMPAKDERPLRSFALAFLTAGPNRSATADERTLLERDELAYFWKLRASGSLVLTAAIVYDSDAQPRSALMVFAVNRLEDARALIEAAPAVKAGHWRLLELHPWVAADGVMKGDG